MPDSPGVSDYTLERKSQVAFVQSPFVMGSNQTFVWPGSQGWALQFNLPKMDRFHASPWEGFISGLYGIANVFVFPIPTPRNTPQGVLDGAPVCATTSSTNQTSATSISVSGMSPMVFGQVNPGDYFNVGARLYVCTEQVNSDANGDMVIPIFPSLRESPANGAPLVFTNPGVLMRLATNDISLHTDYSGLSTLSVTAIEVR
jgi:hypothetical protein